MQAFSSCEMSSMELALQSTYDVPCTIKRPSGTQGTLGYQGGTPTTEVSLNVGVKQPSASVLALYADQIAGQKTTQVRMPSDTNVKPRDLLIMNGETFIVQALLEPQSFNIETNVLASQIAGQGQVQNGG